jgi:hypothetical protein
VFDSPNLQVPSHAGVALKKRLDENTKIPEDDMATNSSRIRAPAGKKSLTVRKPVYHPTTTKSRWVD